MSSSHDSTDYVSESFRLEFLEDFQDRLPKMEAFIEAAKKGTLEKSEALKAFQRELHNIKGTGGAFGFPTLSLICHRFEECLMHLPTVMFGTSRVVSIYMEQLSEIAEAAVDPSESECQLILRSLPMLSETPEEDDRHTQPSPEVIVVAGSGTIRHKVRADLLKFGFHVTTVPDGVVALSLILRGQPDIVIVSRTVDGMSGFDLIRALSSMQATAHIDVAALTSFDLEHPEILMLPAGIPVIQLKRNMHDQIAKAITALEYRALNKV